jgi:hypothetical protein
MILASVPSAARGLGLAGALPFLAAALAVLAGGETSALGRAVLLGYGAVILAFMGGIHWGAAMSQDATSWERLGSSVVPALVGWGGLLLGGRAGLLLLAAAFAALLLHDLAATRRDALPAWYPALRRPLTLIVVACLVLGGVRP